LDMANKHGQHDTRYLEKHQDLWRCVVGYRRDGKVIKLRRSLGTASLREAQHWPAAGSVDTEIGCFRRREARDAEAKVQSRVQDRGGPLGG